MREYPWLFRLSLTNLLQSLSGLLFAFVLHFLFNSLDIGRLSAGSVSGHQACVRVLVCAYHLANQIEWPSFSEPENKFQKSASEWPPVVRCVFTVIVVFCLLSPYESWFQVDFILFFDFVILRPMRRNKSDSIFLTKIYDPQSWRV